MARNRGATHSWPTQNRLARQISQSKFGITWDHVFANAAPRNQSYQRSKPRARVETVEDQLDPIIGKIAFVDATDRLEGARQSSRLRRHALAHDLVGRSVGEVDVDEAARLPVAGEQLFENVRSVAAGGRPMHFTADRENLA